MEIAVLEEEKMQSHSHSQQWASSLDPGLSGSKAQVFSIHCILETQAFSVNYL